MDHQNLPNKALTPWEAMLRAVVSCSGRMLSELLDAGIDPNIADSPNEVGLLTRALQVNFNGGAMMLLNAGASARARGPGLTPPLCAAAGRTEDALEMCEALLRAGALVNEADSDGATALYYAAKWMQIDLCRFLIENGADVCIETNHGKTALSVVPATPGWRSLEIINLLLDAGADPCRVPASKHPLDSYPTSAFQAAVAEGVISHVALFLRRCNADPSQMTGDGRTMIELAPTPDLKELLRAAIVEHATVSAIGGASDEIAAGSRKTQSFSPL